MALERMSTDQCKLIIRGDKALVEEHERRFTAPTVDEVALVVVATGSYRRDIIIQKRGADMYAKIESERLLHIKLNQQKLRVEEYIHLRDAITKYGNVINNGIGRMDILPVTYIGSPRYMHEYAQDGITYVRSYGCPDLFITFHRTIVQ
ncbi:hypothetical protein AVEN_88844-1 [Araneus ventricosus]|uniref:Helitron helicase-like domain-containing protein n=1 Tax=Araneus ventricosus TaxID=182803 RepID=A0A4Y2HSL5_ARAVE|nr:hypothetical protein AVEN_88844-1 [Araneus ventricosus]